jgi:lipid-A-disaccharide synthase
MRIFLSAGEPSGDLHGANLTRALRQAHPGIECVGFGGDRMEQEGCRLIYPLCRHAVMGFLRILSHISSFKRILDQADQFFAEQRPDALVLIDFPGFHWWLAARAKKHGIPVIYFVPPQLWGWGGWRIGKMRRLVDDVLCTLPFEEPWYRARNVPVRYVGHPYFDELHHQQLNSVFIDEQLEQPGTIIGLLPGSRNQELELNMTTLLGAAQRIHAERPETRFLVACFKSEHGQQIEERLRDLNLPIEAHTGRTPEIIHAAKACIAVSGSVGLEMLYQGKPAVVVYRTSRLGMIGVRLLKTCRFISIVNLLADRELYPEFLSHRDEAENAADRILHWLNDDASYAEACRQLADLRSRVAEAGACAKAASIILERLTREALHRAVAA